MADGGRARAGGHQSRRHHRPSRTPKANRGAAGKVNGFVRSVSERASGGFGGTRQVRRGVQCVHALAANFCLCAEGNSLKWTNVVRLPANAEHLRHPRILPLNGSFECNRVLQQSLKVGGRISIFLRGEGKDRRRSQVLLGLGSRVLRSSEECGKCPSVVRVRRRLLVTRPVAQAERAGGRCHRRNRRRRRHHQTANAARVELTKRIAMPDTDGRTGDRRNGSGRRRRRRISAEAKVDNAHTWMDGEGAMNIGAINDGTENCRLARMEPRKSRNFGQRTSSLLRE